MATKINKLSARQVDSLAPGFYSDGAGLYLRVRHSGSRSWVFRYTRQGKVREIGLGGVHGRSLAGARALAGDMRKSLANGRDPATLVPERVGVPATTPTFRDCAEALVASKRPGWRNPKHAQQWENTLRDFVLPHIGDKTPDAVSLADVKAILTPIWATKTETATRVRQRMEAVLDWAYVHGLRSGENPARWRGVLDKVLPPPNKVRTVEHFAAMPYRQIPELMADLLAKPHSSARCLQFLILTATRSIEARGTRWDELDLEGPCVDHSGGPDEGLQAPPGAPLRRGASSADRHAPYCWPASGVLRSSSRSIERRGTDEGREGLRCDGHRARVPVGVSGVGGRTDQCPCSGLRTGLGARQQGPSRGGVSAIRPLRKATGPDAGVGALRIRS